MLFFYPPFFIINTAIVASAVLVVIILSRSGLEEDRSILVWWAAGDIAIIVGRLAPLVQRGVVADDPVGLAWLPPDIIATAADFFVVLGLASHTKAIASLCKIAIAKRATTILLATPFAAAAALLWLPWLGNGTWWLAAAGLVYNFVQLVMLVTRLAGLRGLMIMASAKFVIVGLLATAVANMEWHGTTPPGTGHAAAPFMPAFPALVAGFVDSLFCSFALSIALQERQRAYILWLSTTDPLTGTLNRRGAMPLIRQALDGGCRYQLPVAFAKLDIDHFKRINDQLGHEAGDTVLQCFANALSQLKRKPDILARWGGEEFLLVMPGTTQSAALLAMRRIRNALPDQLEGKAPCAVRFSAGLASLCEASGPGPVLDQLLALSDERLYYAKRTRDCVVDQIPTRDATDRPSAPDQAVDQPVLA